MQVYGKTILAVSLLANATLAYLWLDARRINTSSRSAPPALDATSSRSSTEITRVPTGEIAAATRVRDSLQQLQIPALAVKRMLAAYFEWKIAPPSRPYTYWQSSALREAGERLASFDIDEAKRQAFTAMFGEGAIEDPDLAFIFQPYRDRFPFLSAAKQLELQRLSVDIDRTLLNSGTGPLEARVALSQARQTMGDTVRKLLTDEEFAQYELRSSSAAQTLANSGLNFTQAEFDALYPTMPQESGPIALKRLDAPTMDRARTVLGDQRFREYRRDQDPMYHLLSTITMSHGVSGADVNSAYEMAWQNREQARTLERAGPILSPEDSRKKAQLDAELREKLQTLVGREATDIFVRSLDANRGIMNARAF